MPRILLKRLGLVLNEKFNDIIDKTLYKNGNLYIFYKDGLSDVLLYSKRKFPNKTKSAWSKYYYYIINDEYKGLLFPFNDAEFEYSTNPLSVSIENFKCKYLINQLINFHRAVYLFKDTKHPYFKYHEKEINNRKLLRLSILSSIKNGASEITETVIYDNLPVFNRDYTKILNEIHKKIKIKSINDLINNRSIKQWCQQHQKDYGQGDLYFIDTLDWGQNPFIKTKNKLDWIIINEEYFESIKQLPHCIVVTDILGNRLCSFLNPQISFDFKIKLKFSKCNLTIMVW